MSSWVQVPKADGAHLPAPLFASGKALRVQLNTCEFEGASSRNRHQKGKRADLGVSPILHM